METMFSFRISCEQKDRLKLIASRKRRDASEVLRKLVEDYVKRESRKQERQEKAVEAR